MIFKSNLKIYFFKETQTISLSIKVTDNYVNTYTFTKDEFDFIVSNWESKEGASIQTNNYSWLIQHKKRGPRPICEPANFVRITKWQNNQSFDYRVSYDDMIQAIKDYYYQQNNKMHWDKE